MDEESGGILLETYGAEALWVYADGSASWTGAVTPIFIHKRNMRRGEIICCESKPSGVASTPRGARSYPAEHRWRTARRRGRWSIPLLQHIGKPCTPLVKAGDHVDMGQKIGDGEDCASLFTPRCQAP